MYHVWSNVIISVTYNPFLVKPTDVLEELEETAYRNELDKDCDDFFNPSNSTDDCRYLNYCNKHGKCVDGKCECFTGWINYDCSISKNKK